MTGPRPALPPRCDRSCWIVDLLVGLAGITARVANPVRGIDLNMRLDAPKAARSTLARRARLKGWREVVPPDLPFGDQTVDPSLENATVALRGPRRRQRRLDGQHRPGAEEQLHPTRTTPSVTVARALPDTPPALPAASRGTPFLAQLLVGVVDAWEITPPRLGRPTSALIRTCAG